MINWESTFSVQDKVILVSGASSGIGKQLASDLAETGAKLIVTGRDKHRLRETWESLDGEGHRYIVCDLTIEEQLESLVQELPPLDGFVHCAGVLSICPVSHSDMEDAKFQLRVNYLSALSLSQKMLARRLWTYGSSVVFVSSVSARKASKGFGLYSASKAALEAFARVLALEVAGQGIRVNCIAAGMVRTPMYDMAKDLVTEEAMAEHEKLYPLGFADPHEISPTVMFLLSRAAAKITGTTITIDGGFSL
jgi:NAD(P)-dependent dehydrogenase (short-subunit alcohol dehydrogenase family)